MELSPDFVGLTLDVRPSDSGEPVLHRFTLTPGDVDVTNVVSWMGELQTIVRRTWIPGLWMWTLRDDTFTSTSPEGVSPDLRQRLDNWAREKLLYQLRRLWEGHEDLRGTLSTDLATSILTQVLQEVLQPGFIGDLTDPNAVRVHFSTHWEMTRRHQTDDQFSQPQRFGKVWSQIHVNSQEFTVYVCYDSGTVIHQTLSLELVRQVEAKLEEVWDVVCATTLVDLAQTINEAARRRQRIFEMRPDNRDALIKLERDLTSPSR